MYDLETLKRLHLINSGGVPIHAISAVMTRSGIVTGYPGGVTAFRRDHPLALEANGLITLVSMSSGELYETLESIAAQGVDIRTCCSVADVLGGPLEECEAIELFPTWDRPLNRGWMARLKQSI
jgi:hypothetical protein